MPSSSTESIITSSLPISWTVPPPPPKANNDLIVMPSLEDGLSADELDREQEDESNGDECEEGY